MMDWLLRILGISDSVLSRLDRAALLWQRPALLWLGLALLAPIAVFIVRRQRRNLPHVSPALRGLLSACRVGVLLLLVIVLAGPYLRIEEDRTLKPILAVLVDESASMLLPAGPFDDAEAQRLAEAAGLMERSGEEAKPPAAEEAPSPDPALSQGERVEGAGLSAEVRRQLNTMSREELGQRVLARQREGTFEALAQRFDVRAYRSAKGVRPATLGQPPSAALAGAEGDETDLGAAIEHVLDDAAGKPLAGIVLLSDGRWTTGPDPIQVIQSRHVRGAADLSDADAAPRPAGGSALAAAPVWTVPVGGVRPPPDVAVIDVLAPAHVARGDTISVVATIDSHGFDNRAVTVRLLREGEAIDEKPLTLSGAERQQVQLTFAADEPGTALLTVAVDEQAEEQVRQNNTAATTIEVDTEKLRVLLLEGTPRWDFRFLDHALRRDNGLDVTLVMESQLVARGANGAELATAAGLPQDAAGWAEYAVVILGDVSAALLPPRAQEQLAKAVEEDGVGLIVQAGSASMPAAFAGSRLARLLPVSIEPPASPSAAPNSALALVGVAPSAPGGIEAPAFAPFQMRVTASGAIHPAFRLYDSAAQNRAVWSRMPEFYWAAAVGEGNPGATVLARLEAPGVSRPLIAEAYAGRGRVLFLGADSTYRWRRNIGSHLFYRFWGQTIRHMARDKQRGADQSWIEVFPRRLEPGETVSVELYAVDRQGEPLRQAALEVQIAGADTAERLTLGAAPQPGYFRGPWQPRGLGQYRLGYTDATGRAVTAALQVAGSGRELRRPIVDREMLGALADASGGQLLELHELPRLGQLVQGEPRSVTEEAEDEVWDNWLTLVLLVGLYCTDVGVRRLLGLT